ncbi:hypothetical protein Rhe02_58100 [Rhizocola hellebori]|uniref:DUF4232 domain-containing protein n=1 Tax=Rhizocola hellebori TaxID=1392758 RepID=A0A8J3QBE0_9ACTN|nr:hypothetical protein Rhe02_58100 [Rhizocola hellebori]
MRVPLSLAVMALAIAELIVLFFVRSRPATETDPPAAGPATACRTDELALSYGPRTTTSPYGGQFTVAVLLTNKSAHGCLLAGLPTVTLNGPDHRMFGPAFQLRTSDEAVPADLTLSPGGRAHIDLTYLVGGGGASGTEQWVPTMITVGLGGAGNLTLAWSSGEAVPRQDAATHPGSYASGYINGG